MSRAGASAGLSLALAAVLGAGCAYRLGPSSGAEPGARTIAIRPFDNKTYEARVTANLATSLRAQLQQEGTYRLARHGDADIVVEGQVLDITRREESFQSRDIRTVRDYRLNIVAHVVATDRRSGKTLLDRQVEGHTMLRVQEDLASVERQAMPLLTDNLARNITSMLVDGTW